MKGGLYEKRGIFVSILIGLGVGLIVSSTPLKDIRAVKFIVKWFIGM